MTDATTPGVPELQPIHDEGHGYDVFGLEPRAVALALRRMRFVFDHYLRVHSYGLDHVPRQGAAILVANHSGVLPVDAAMLWYDVVRGTGRVLRTVADRFVPRLPLVGTVFARVGAVGGSRASVRRLLARGELLAIFPEGVSGVAKPFRQRYQLQEWRVGHVEEAIRHRAPVVPVAIIGAEESWPLAVRLGVRLFGAPYLPLPVTPLPMPVRIDLHYGEPLALHELGFTDPDDPAVTAAAAARTRAAVEALIATARAARRAA